MSQQSSSPSRFIGLDVHKHYLVAYGVDPDRNHLFGPTRVRLSHLQSWMNRFLSPQDAVALEMTTNSFQLYDDRLLLGLKGTFSEAQWYTMRTPPALAPTPSHC